MMVWDKELKLAGSIDMLYKNPDGTSQLMIGNEVKNTKANRWNKYSKTKCILYTRYKLLALLSSTKYI